MPSDQSGAIEPLCVSDSNANATTPTTEVTKVTAIAAGATASTESPIPTSSGASSEPPPIP